MATPDIDRSAPVRVGEELDLERLEPYLADRLGLDGPLAVEQFPSGFSNLTYLLRAGDRELVLRRPPFGSKVKTAHDMGREHRVLAALFPVWPKVPRPLLYCDDASILGAPFYLMEPVRGIVLRPRMSVEQVPPPAEMARVADALVATLAELHAVDVGAAGLGDFGKPAGYVARQVAGWAKRYEGSRTDDLPTMERAAAWLAGHQPREQGSAARGPAGRGAVLIHNDYKYDNLVLDADDLGRVRAVLDWEMATVGDPLMDLGTALGYWVDPDDPPILRKLRLSPTDLPGNPSRAAVAETYARKSGRDLGDLVFYYVFGLFKIAVIAQQIYYRYARGLTKDARFGVLIQGVRALADTAVQAIDRRRIDRLYSN